jgi:isochorismate pyruvate lyase
MLAGPVDSRVLVAQINTGGRILMQKSSSVAAAVSLLLLVGCAARHGPSNVTVETFIVHMTEQPIASDKPSKLSPDEEKALLAPYRAKIDVLDTQIVALLGQRFGVIRDVAKLKAEHGIAPILPDRVEEVVRKARGKAEQAGVNPDLVERIYRIIIDTACAEEADYALEQRAKKQ